jgi:hypothetical protein
VGFLVNKIKKTKWDWEVFNPFVFNIPIVIPPMLHAHLSFEAIGPPDSVTHHS